MKLGARYALQRHAQRLTLRCSTPHKAYSTGATVGVDPAVGSIFTLLAILAAKDKLLLFREHYDVTLGCRYGVARVYPFS